MMSLGAVRSLRRPMILSHRPFRVATIRCLTLTRRSCRCPAIRRVQVLRIKSWLLHLIPRLLTRRWLLNRWRLMSQSPWMTLSELPRQLRRQACLGRTSLWLNLIVIRSSTTWKSAVPHTMGGCGTPRQATDTSFFLITWTALGCLPTSRRVL